MSFQGLFRCLALMLHHPQPRIIKQRFGHRAQVMRSPDQLLIALLQPCQGHVAYIAHQLGCLFAGALAADAWLDAKEWVGLVFALVERCQADRGGRLWGGCSRHLTPWNL